MTVRVIGPNSKKEPAAINVSAKNSSWASNLAPGRCGPVKLYGNFVAQNVENALHFAQVRDEFTDSNGNITIEYIKWAKKGWNYKRAVCGQEDFFKPVYFLWNGNKLTPQEIRKNVFIPLYIEAVRKSDAFLRLKSAFIGNPNLVLFDVDANEDNCTIRHAINDYTKPLSHAYILSMLLQYGVDFDAEYLP